MASSRGILNIQSLNELTSEKTPAVIARRLGARGVAVPPPPPRRMCVDSFVRILHARLQAMPLNLYSGLPAISSNS